MSAFVNTRLRRIREANALNGLASFFSFSPTSMFDILINSFFVHLSSNMKITYKHYVISYRNKVLFRLRIAEIYE